MATLSVGGTTVYNGTSLDNGAFPAGHIVQIRNAVTGPSSQINTSGTGTDTGITDTITITSGNIVMAVATITLVGAGGGTDAGCRWYFYSVGSSAQIGIGMTYYWEAPGSANPQHRSPSCYLYGPYTPASTSEQVKIYYSGLNGATCYIDAQQASLQLWEVAG